MSRDDYDSVGIDGLVVAIYGSCVIFILYTTVLAFWKPPRAKDSPLVGLTWARASLAIATL
jgi:hypothetical protein